MNRNGFLCPQCRVCYRTTIALGRHLQNAHRSSTNSHGNACLRQSSSHQSETADHFHMENTEEFLSPSGDVLNDETVDINIADEVINLYETFNDTSEPLFEDIPELSVPLTELKTPARNLFLFCAAQGHTRRQMKAQYDFVLSSIESKCDCVSPLLEQFSTSSKFVSYVEKARKHVVAKQGWRKATIDTKFGPNSTGVFRSIVDLVSDIVKNAGGLSSIVTISKKFKEGVRVYTSPVDSDSMCSYFESIPTNALLIAIDIYSDGTTISNSGSQSLCLLRIRPVNVRGESTTWHEVGIEPVLYVTDEYSDSVLSMERSLLKQRFLYLLLKDTVVAARTGFILEGRLVFLRINTLVCDQKEERAMLSLKSKGSYMDCSHCLLPSLSYTSRSGNFNLFDLPYEAITPTDVDVYAQQIEKNNKAPLRCVNNTVSRQLFVARSKIVSNACNEQYFLNAQELAAAKEYLKRTSASQLPPALSAVYGLGSPPFHLYQCVGLDKLHAVDLGILRALPDFAFTLFSSVEYNCGLYSSRELVRIANRRFRDMQHITGVYVKPFRSTSDEKHANMTGKIRRSIAPFLWVALMGLHPEALPDEDLLLQSSLAMDRFQTLIRSINMSDDAGDRSENEIERIQSVAFDSCLWLSKALGLPISTKLHRVMRHVKDHLIQFGCARRGDSDSNETLHKNTKQAIRATNHRLNQISSQVLSIRSVTSVLSRGEEDISINNGSSIDCLYPLVDALNDESEDNSEMDYNNDETVGTTDEEEPMHIENRNTLRNEIIQNLKRVVQGHNVDLVKISISSLRHPISFQHIWYPITRIRIKATVPWNLSDNENQDPIFQVVYATPKSNSKNSRYDTVQYDTGAGIYFGVVHLLLRGKNFQETFIVAIIRRLIEIEPEPGNQRVTELFYHRRFAYELRSEPYRDVKLDCVLIQNVSRTVPMVPDMYDLTKRTTISIGMFSIEDTLENRRLAKFFLVNGKQVTSLSERSV